MISCHPLSIILHSEKRNPHIIRYVSAALIIHCVDFESNHVEKDHSGLLRGVMDRVI